MVEKDDTNVEAIRTEAKNLFRHGKIKDSFAFLEKHQKETKDLLESVSSLLLLARLKQEIGLFVPANNHLKEVNTILEDHEESLKQQSIEKYLHYKCKYFHILAKNQARSLYHQRSKETFEDALAFLEKLIGHDNIKSKYLCKVYEGLGHLYCEPMLFVDAEEFILKAEKIYNEIKASDYVLCKFLLKKASFMKKYGFFDTSLSVLAQAERISMDCLSKKDPQEEKSKNKLQKILFKVNRDRARIQALKREEKQALKSHSNAELFIKALYPDVVNIKIAKLQLIKGLWVSKFDFAKSNDELIDAYHMFVEATGDEDNYFGANCQLEMSTNYLRLKDPQISTAWLSKANDTLEKLFGEDHALLQKYYSYTTEVFSYSDEYDSMVEFVNKYYAIVERSNVARNGKPSLFIMDALAQKIGVYCQTQSLSQEVLEQVKQMDLVLLENGFTNGCQLLHSALTMKSILHIREEKVKEAMEILEETYLRQVKQLKNDPEHPFLEQSIGQLALLYKVNQRTEDSERMYGHLVKIKELYYGLEAESLVNPLKNLATVQAINTKSVEALETLLRAGTIAKKVLAADKSKDKNALKANLIEILFTAYSIQDHMKLHQQALETINSHMLISKELHGEKSSQYAYSLFLKSKSLLGIEGKDKTEALENITKAIQIEEELQSTRTNKTHLLGRFYYCGATLFNQNDNPQKALEYFLKSKEILQGGEGLDAIIEEINKQIQSCKNLIGTQTTSNTQKTKTDNSTDTTQYFIGGVGILALAIAGVAIYKISKQ